MNAHAVNTITLVVTHTRVSDDLAGPQIASILREIADDYDNHRLTNMLQGELAIYRNGECDASVVWAPKHNNPMASPTITDLGREILGADHA